MLAALSVTKKQRSGTKSSVARQSRKEGRIVRKIHARVEHRNPSCHVTRMLPLRLIDTPQIQTVPDQNIVANHSLFHQTNKTSTKPCSFDPSLIAKWQTIAKDTYSGNGSDLRLFAYFRISSLNYLYKDSFYATLVTYAGSTSSLPYFFRMHFGNQAYA